MCFDAYVDVEELAAKLRETAKAPSASQVLNTNVAIELAGSRFEAVSKSVFHPIFTRSSWFLPVFFIVLELKS